MTPWLCDTTRLHPVRPARRDLGHPLPADQDRGRAARPCDARARPDGARRGRPAAGRGRQGRAHAGPAAVAALARVHAGGDGRAAVPAGLGRGAAAKLDDGPADRGRAAGGRGRRVPAWAPRAARPPELARHRARHGGRGRACRLHRVGLRPRRGRQGAVVVVGYALGPAIIAKWMPDLPGTGVIRSGSRSRRWSTRPSWLRRTAGQPRGPRLR